MTDTQAPESAGLVLDPDQGAYVAIFGRKGSGKSELAKSYFRAYPYDRIVFDSNDEIDPEGTYTLDVGPGLFEWPTLEEWAERLLARRRRCATLPAQRPVERRRSRPELPPYPSLRYAIDFTDDELMPNSRVPHWLYLVDQVIKLAYHLGRPVCIWVDEVGDIFPVGKTQGNSMQALHKGRHKALTLLMAGPRPYNVEVLVLSQSDLVCIFEMPHELDRQRVAAHCAIPINELGPMLDNFEEHGYLAFFAASHSVAILPPLELDAAKR